ncbi:MAG TPA: toll/interleukin-1 receptor domain-containing protein, partial [Hyphomonadaceae bacterium]|nr:toll/interleukin-1 receptor domain-containing protein [Hyphomonadaceae bacterium]
MTDVYIAYAREDRESVRRLSEMLGFEGWDVWMDPSEPSTENRAAVDLKLGSAGAILVVWSGYSRGSEYVRSEAATGLYKNKLIQVRIDSATPPRPFDQVEVLDIGRWSGDRDDPNWRKIMAAVRL